MAAIRRWFAEHSTWQLDGQPSQPEAVAQVLRSHGVERFVFCSYAHRAGMARELNAWLTVTSRALGGYGIPLATVHLDDPGYLDDLDLALADGCVGLKVHEDVQRLHLDDDRFTPVLERFDGRGFVLAHVGPIPWRTEPDAPKRIEKVLRRHSRVRLVVAHMGGEAVQAYVDLMERYPNLYLDTTMGLAAESPMRVSIDPALIEAHAGQIVYGTDFPNIPYAYDGELRALDAMGISQDAKSKIVRENAKHLIGSTLKHEGMRLRVGISYGPERGPYPHYAAAARAAGERLGIDVEAVDLSDGSTSPDTVDAIVFTGGGDIAPERFGKGDESDRVEGVDAARDELEFGLLQAARDRELPILGICRGAQLINVGFGGDLVTHIDHADAHVKTAAGKDARHDVVVSDGSLIGRLSGAGRARVNSSHHQAVGRLAEPFAVTALAEDGTVEAYEWAQPGGKPFLLAVQWHPERMDQKEKLAGPLFERFLQAVTDSARVPRRR